MTLLDEIEDFFGTRNLYDVIAADKESSHEAIKKAYRRASLKIHPDRAQESDKDNATKRFQVLAQVHYILSDPERRKLYDDHGIIANDDGLDSEADWSAYWRLLFPKISSKDIEKFMDSYVDSKEEEDDLIELYNRYQGDLDKISESHISYDEERTTELLNRLIEEKKIPKFRKFTGESQSKKVRRNKRAQKEAKQAEKLKEEIKRNSGKDVDNLDDLTALIKGRNNFESMISSLEAKYAKAGKGKKRKRSDN